MRARRISAVFVVMSTCTSFLLAINACGDDDDGPTSRSGSSSGTSGANPNPTATPTAAIPPYTPGPTPPPDLIDRTGGVLGNAALVVDVGQPIDGPSWRAADNALYFTVPGQAPTLRRLLAADGGVEGVALYDGGAPGPYGTATGGGSTLFVTEPAAIGTLAPDNGTFTRRPGTFGLLGDVAATAGPDGGQPIAFFVDTSTDRAYRFDPNLPVGSDLTRVLEQAALDAGPPDPYNPYSFDAGLEWRATGIAVGKDDLSKETIYIALSTGARGRIVSLQLNAQTGKYDSTGRDIDLGGTPPNGIAVDEQGYLYVAWAAGVDVYERGRPIISPSIPIAAAPTSLAFGGADRKTLFVATAKGKLYAIPTLRPGVLR